MSTGAGAEQAPVRLALLGTRGFGAVYLRALEGPRAEGRVDLVGVVDVLEPEPDVDAPWFPSLTALLEELEPQRRPQIVIIATPIPSHAPLALEAIAAGCDVMLEKPPVSSLADHRTLLAAAESAGRTVQVGFQARGGGGIDRLRQLMADGELGPVRAVTAYGAWTRDLAYYARSPWAGLRRRGDVRIADGVATNPLAHAVHAALTVAGMLREQDVARVITELRHAHDIEADDTAFLRVDPVADDAPPVLAALTTTAPEQSDPWIEVVGERGRARLFYTDDRAEIAIQDQEPRSETYERVAPLENLMAHLADPSVALLCPLADTSAFTAVLEATQSVPDPRPIAPEHIAWQGEGPAAHPVVQDVEHWMARALEEGRPYSEIGAPWADAEAVHVWADGAVER